MPVDAIAATNKLDWITEVGVYRTFINDTAVAPDGRIYVVGSAKERLRTDGWDIAKGEREAFIQKRWPSGGQIWTRQFGTSGMDEASGVAVGSQGNVYVVGSLGEDGFMRKYSPRGDLLWLRTLGKGTAVGEIAIGGRGSIYLSGGTAGALPNQQSKGGVDAFIRKYSPRGGIYWTRQFGTTGSDLGWNLTIDSRGQVYVVGSTTGALMGQTSAGQDDAFIRKYSPRGGIYWTRQFGRSSADAAVEVAVDSRRNVVVVGSSGPRAFARKYSTEGRRIWTRLWSKHWANDVAIDSEDNVYVVGQTLSSSDYSKAFVRQYSAGGTLSWTSYFRRGLAFGAAIDDEDNLYVAGTRATDYYGPKTNPAGSNAFLARFVQ